MYRSTGSQSRNPRKSPGQSRRGPKTVSVPSQKQQQVAPAATIGSDPYRVYNLKDTY